MNTVFSQDSDFGFGSARDNDRKFDLVRAQLEEAQDQKDKGMRSVGPKIEEALELLKLRSVYDCQISVLEAELGKKDIPPTYDQSMEIIGKIMKLRSEYRQQVAALEKKYQNR